MKKLSVVFILSLIICTPLLADSFEPFYEESWVVGFSGNFTAPKRDVNNTITLLDSQLVRHYDTFSGTQFNVAAHAGYCPIDFLALGLEGEFTRQDRRFLPDERTASVLNPFTQIIEEKISSQDMEYFVGPWARYYIQIPDKDFAFYPELSIGYVSTVYRHEFTDSATHIYKQELTGFGYNAGLGVAVLLTNRLSLDVSGRYCGGILTGIETREPVEAALETKLRGNRKNFEFGVGMHFYLGR